MTTHDVVIAHPSDHGARQLVHLLTGRGDGRTPVLVSPDTLASAQWSHAIDAAGRASTRLTLPNGLCLESHAVGSVLNRLQWLSVPSFRNASAKDRDYADMEMQALLTSWLTELGDRVVPSVRRHLWLTPSLTTLCWGEAIAAAGLPLSPSPSGKAEAHPCGSVLIAGNQLGGSLAEPFGEPCRQVAQRLGFPLLMISFEDRGTGPAVGDVSPFPPLLEAWEVQLVARMVATHATTLQP